MEKEEIIMLVAIILIITVVPIILFSLIVPQYEQCERFKMISKQKYRGDTNIEIIYDTETKVKYIYIAGHHSDGITALIDADGKPLLYEGE